MLPESMKTDVKHEVCGKVKWIFDIPNFRQKCCTFGHLNEEEKEDIAHIKLILILSDYKIFGWISTYL